MKNVDELIVYQPFTVGHFFAFGKFFTSAFAPGDTALWFGRPDVSGCLWPYYKSELLLKGIESRKVSTS
jgi:hypothetical protein